MDRWDLCTLCMCIFGVQDCMSGEKLLATLPPVWGIWTRYLAGKLRCHSKLAYSLTYCIWVVHWLNSCWPRCGSCIGYFILWRPGFLPDVYGFCSETPSSLPLGSSFRTKADAGLDHWTGSVAMAPLWHTGVSSFKPRVSCCNWSQIAFSFQLDCMYISVHVNCLCSFEQAHMRQCM